jgi:serine/threonine-protein kinase
MATDRTATAKSAKASAPDPLIGRVINDRYKVLALVARGGMGKVYRAEQSALGRVCALKVLNPNYSGDHDPEFHKRFSLEASMTSKLRHPNTVTIFDYGRTEDDIYYIAMEYLEGHTLHRAIRQAGTFPEERCAHIARQVCRSLREAHTMGVIHRDLKPANIYLLEHGDEPDYVKVLDFGLVKNVADNGGEELTQAGLFMGSPKYMAPEQITGGSVDARTDIYALGVIMYEMLAGKVPFERASNVEVLHAHVNDAPPPIREVNPSARISQAMDETITRMLAKDPEHRFRSMDDVVAALKRLGPVFPAEPSSSLVGDRPADSQVKSTSGPQPTKHVAPQGSAIAVPAGAGVAPDAAATQPAEAQPAPSAPASRQFPMGLVAAVAVGVLLIVGAVVLTRKPAPPPAASTTASTPTTAAAATSTATPTPTAGATTAAGGTGAAPSPDIQTVDVSSLAPVASGAAAKPAPASAPVPPPKPKPGPAAAAAPPAPAPHPAAAPPAPAAKGAPDCNPSYYYDADGNKHFKPECFGH